MNYSVIWKEKLEDMGATVKNRKVASKSLQKTFADWLLIITYYELIIVQISTSKFCN